MARNQEAGQGRLIVSVIHSSLDAMAESLTALEKKFGLVQFETMEFECADQESYREEMGENLIRRFFSFERTIERDRLPTAKAVCSKVEQQFADNVDGYPFRTVNIDPGIITPSNIIIASHREYNHSVYLEDGVFAELMLVWGKDGFVRLPWTSPDFYHDEAVDFFLRVRDCFDLVEQAELF